MYEVNYKEMKFIVFLFKQGRFLIYGNTIINTFDLCVYRYYIASNLNV